MEALCSSKVSQKQKKNNQSGRFQFIRNFRKIDIKKEGRQTLRCEIKEFM